MRQPLSSPNANETSSSGDPELEVPQGISLSIALALTHW